MQIVIVNEHFSRHVDGQLVKFVYYMGGYMKVGVYCAYNNIDYHLNINFCPGSGFGSVEMHVVKDLKDRILSYQIVVPLSTSI